MNGSGLFCMEIIAQGICFLLINLPSILHQLQRPSWILFRNEVE